MTFDDSDFSDVATLTRAAPEHASKNLAFRLRVTEPVEASRTVVLDESRRLLIGQSPVCEVRLADREASRRHAAISVEGSRARIVDLGSTNGTWLDGVPVRDAFLEPGHVVRVGATELRLEPLDEAPVELPAATSFGRTMGGSPAMRSLYAMCARIAASAVPVILEGETGTGKEVLAESLHEQGPRAARPFVVFDCTAVPPNLVESELFGHERGAFTGAVSARKGVFELAHTGTLLIDEIGDLDLSLQPKLLRAIERAEFRRVGGSQLVKVDVRLLAATRRDLDHEIQAGRFRDDLFHRLAVARLELPPLRARTSDIAMLARHFWRELGGDAARFPREACARWAEYAWPGNVRELRNAVARHLALGDLATPPAARASAATPREDADFLDRIVAEGVALPVGRRKVVEEYERRYIARVLAEHDGNVGKAAAASGIARRYFQTIRARSSDKG
jgi:DNA-binding NtrC family response regulator